MIVLREGSTAELNSSCHARELQRPDVSRWRCSGKVTSHSPLANSSRLIYKARKGMSQGSNVTVRGVGPMSFKLRSGFQTVAGRMFQPGLTEAVVSKRIAERFQGLDIGDKFRIQTTDYTVVGLFDSAGKAFESEIWVDINSLASTTKRESYSSVLMRVKDQNALAALASESLTIRSLHLKAVSERTFYEDQQGTASGALEGTGCFHLVHHGGRRGLRGNEHDVCGGRATDERDRHAARAWVSAGISILIAFLLESVAIALIGVAIGIVLALPLNFVSTGTSNWVTFSEIAFNFRVTPDLMLFALIFGGLSG